MKKWIAKRPNGVLLHSIPETYYLDIPDLEYFEEALHDVPEIRDMVEGEEVWIAKPSLTNQALSIVVFDRVSQLREAIEQAVEIREWVVQRYIHPPLLLNGKKFHIRSYVLCVGQLDVYVWKEMLTLCSRERYDSALRQLDNRSAHLTNTCLQGENPTDAVYLLSELPQLMGDEELSEHVQGVMHQICGLIKECFEALSCELSFLPLPNCFEFFGFDFLVDASWNCWLLEANAEPDFKQTGERLRAKLQEMFEDAFQIIIDPIHPYNPTPWVHRPLPEGNSWAHVFERSQGG